MEFYKNKLKEKIDLILKSKGIDNNIELKDSLFIGLRPGKYEILWDLKGDKILSLMPITGDIKVENGVYYIHSNNSNRILYSSQYIEFNSQDERDEKIKKILKSTKTILITGGSGYIGTHTIVELLKDDNYNVIILDSFYNSTPLILNGLKKITNKPVKVYNRDCRDNLDDIFTENNIDAVIHFAALKSLNESVEDPISYYDNNINSLLNLVNTCRKFSVNNFIFSSSYSLYGNVLPGDLPVSEDTPLNEPESPYDYTKLVGERILRDISLITNIKTISLRYFNPVGAHESGLIGELPINKPNNILPVICSSVDGDSMIIFGDDYDTHDGTCIRDYVHVSDIANAHYLATEFIFYNMENKYEVFNLGSESGYSVLNLIKIFEEENSVKVKYNIGSRRPGDIVEIYSDSSKAKRLLKWTPKRTIDDIVRSSWNWYKNMI
jgi:UDP-glucose 4-epimerase